MYRRLNPRKETPVTHWTEDWVGGEGLQRRSQGYGEVETCLPLPGTEPQSSCPSLVTQGSGKIKKKWDLMLQTAVAKSLQMCARACEREPR